LTSGDSGALLGTSCLHTDKSITNRRESSKHVKAKIFYLGDVDAS
jgi:hypothetical protein